MTVVAAPTAEQELQELYARYKSLALSTSATLMLGGALEPLGDSLEELLGDCRAAQERGAVYAGELARCTEAAASLRPLLGGDPTAGALERARRPICACGAPCGA